MSERCCWRVLPRAKVARFTLGIRPLTEYTQCESTATRTVTLGERTYSYCAKHMVAARNLRALPKKTQRLA